MDIYCCYMCMNIEYTCLRVTVGTDGHMLGASTAFLHAFESDNHLYQNPKMTAWFPQLKSIWRWWHIGILKVSSFPSSFIFYPFILLFFPRVGAGGGFAIPAVRFFFSLSSDRSLFPGFVSVICGHYINSHGWPEEWEKGCDTHPDPTNRWSWCSGSHFSGDEISWPVHWRTIRTASG